MACNPARFARLPIPEQHKQLLMAFSADPANDAASTQLCQASDQEIIAAVSQIAPAQSEGQGVPLDQQGGIGSLPQGPQSPAPQTQAGGIPPGQLANVSRPMDTPPSGQGNAGIGGLLNRGY